MILSKVLFALVVFCVFNSVEGAPKKTTKKHSSPSHSPSQTSSHTPTPSPSHTSSHTRGLTPTPSHTPSPSTAKPDYVSAFDGQAFYLEAYENFPAGGNPAGNYFIGVAPPVSNFSPGSPSNSVSDRSSGSPFGFVKCQSGYALYSLAAGAFLAYDQSQELFHFVSEGDVKSNGYLWQIHFSKGSKWTSDLSYPKFANWGTSQQQRSDKQFNFWIDHQASDGSFDSQSVQCSL